MIGFEGFQTPNHVIESSFESCSPAVGDARLCRGGADLRTQPLEVELDLRDLVGQDLDMAFDPVEPRTVGLDVPSQVVDASSDRFQLFQHEVVETRAD